MDVLARLTRITLIPFPFMNPANPSAFHMRTKLDQTPPYASPFAPGELLCTCLSVSDARSSTHRIIFNRSKGATAVLLAAPARPPGISTL